MGGRRRIAWLGLVGALVTRPAVAQSGEPAPLAAPLRVVGQTVATRYSVTSAFTEAFRKRLSGGLTSRAVSAVRK